MSTLKVNDIIEATSGGGKVFPCRGWINFNGTGTVSIRDDAGTSSLTDVATGKYNQNLSNALSNSSYSATGTGHYAAAYWINALDNYALSTSSVRIHVGSANSNTDGDADQLSCQVFGYS